MSIKTTIEDIANPIAESMNFELVDIEYVKEGKDKFLRIYIDKYEGSIGVEDCKEFSKALNLKIEEIDPIKEAYYLEVSSPGIDRALKKDSDFERFKGRDVDVKLYKALDKRKEFQGELLGLFDDVIKINEEGNILEFDKKDIAIVRLAVKF